MEFFQANIHLEEVLVQLAAFVIVFWTLKRLAWKNLLAALEARREKIQRAFQEIENAKKEIESLRLEYNAHLQKIEEEARGKIQEAIEEGRRIARQIQEKARTQSQTTLEKAKENLNLEVAKARITLRRELADLAIQASEKILQERLTEAKQHEKVITLLEELEQKL